MQGMMIAGGFKCTSTTTTTGPAIAGDTGYGLGGELFEGAYRNDFLKRDEFQKRFVSSMKSLSNPLFHVASPPPEQVQLFNNYVDTFRSDLHHLRN